MYKKFTDTEIALIEKEYTEATKYWEGLGDKGKLKLCEDNGFESSNATNPIEHVNEEVLDLLIDIIREQY